MSVQWELIFTILFCLVEKVKIAPCVINRLYGMYSSTLCTVYACMYLYVCVMLVLCIIYVRTYTCVMCCMLQSVWCYTRLSICVWITSEFYTVYVCTFVHVCMYVYVCMYLIQGCGQSYIAKSGSRN